MTTSLARGSRHVRGLRRLGIRPIKAQVRVTDPGRKLTTLIDLVGVGANNTLWVVEIKATTLTTANHNKAYPQPCRRTPMLRNAIVHSEQATHFLQVAFGALALRRNYEIPPDVRIKSCVLVATTDSCRTYVCPPHFLRERLLTGGTRFRFASPKTSNLLERRLRHQKPRVPWPMPPTAPWPKKGSTRRRIDARWRCSW